MPYTIEFAPSAADQFKKLPKDLQTRSGRRIDSLAINPRPQGITQLKAEEALYRLRVSDYRIIYTIQEEALIVLVVKIGHRKDVYRRIT